LLVIYVRYRTNGGTIGKKAGKHTSVPFAAS
jgi:hypothetical protein